MSRSFRVLAFCLLFCATVIPNSLQIATAVLLVLSAGTGLMLANPLRRTPRLVLLYLVSVAVSIIFILVGQIRGAPTEAGVQGFIIYIASPILWLAIANALFLRIDDERISRWFIFFACAAIASVAIYFYLFLKDGADAVKFFIQDPNLNLEEGYSGATMFVYGSLIFLSAGFFASPGTIKNGLLRLLILISLPVVAITSGRGALILAIPVGVLIGALLSQKNTSNQGGAVGRLIASPVFFAISGAIGVMIATLYSGVDVNLIVGRFFDEVKEFGGTERSAQAVALLQGIVDTFAIGAGHGIGVDLIRSESYPWRYEMVPLATIYRVGAIGAFVYALPFAIYVAQYFKLRRKKLTNSFDLFMFAGSVSALIAANTNPYIEAFSFQWMFVLPLVAMELKTRALAKQF